MRKMLLVVTMLFVSLSTFFAHAAHAAPVHVNSLENTEYHFTVDHNGFVGGYFLGGTAGLTDILSVIINGVESPVTINNHTANITEYFNFGQASAGDEVIFRLHTSAHKDWFSDLNMNSDGLNHVKAIPFTSHHPVIDGVGLYLGFEDLPKLGDRDWNDLTAAFVNVNLVSAVPEPETYAMLLVGLGLIGWSTRRKS